MTRTRQALAVAVMVGASMSGLGAGAASAQSVREQRDVVYATVNGKPLALDLYMPAGVAAPPLVVWVHGGRWMNGDKSDVPMAFVERGIATASVDFRQSGEAAFFGPGRRSTAIAPIGLRLRGPRPVPIWRRWWA
jgi:acetyl esterase/lipase